MLGLMQDRPLLISQMIDFAAALLSRRRDRHPHGRGPDPSLRLPRRGASAPSSWPRRCRAWASSSATASAPRLEHPSPLRALFRHLRPRRRAAHPQPAAGARACGLHRQPCRGPGHLRRPQPAADRRGRVPAPQDGEARRGHDRPRPHAGLEQDPQPAVLRGADRRQARHAQVARLRREDRLVALLHLGHDRQPEGRALLAPLDRHPFDDDVLGPGAGADAGRRHPAGGADVPRQCLGPRLCRADLRRQAGVPRAQARRRQRLRAARQGAGDPVGRRADGVARPARLLRAEQAQDVVGQAQPDRRLGGALRHDRALLEGARDRGRAGLGHDRDEPARHADPLQQGRDATCPTPSASPSPPSRAGRCSAAR